MKANSFYSIIIPVYNTPISYLDQCLLSLVDQTFHDIEIILVDDGSGYEISEACNRYAEKDSRVKVIHQKNQGVSAARNTGIKKASGEWIMFVDADDWLELDACEKLYERLKSKACDILMFNHVRDYDGKQVLMKYGLEPDKLYNMDIISDKELLYKRAMGAPDAAKGWSSIITYSWDKVFRAEFLKDSKVRFPIGLSKSEDKVFVLSCFEKIDTLYYMEKALYHYRMNTASVCNRYSEDADMIRKRLIDILDEIAKRMDLEIGTILNDPNYKGVSQELNRYIFGLISDVLLLKYYHKDNPNSVLKRHRDSIRFIRSEPFNSSIRGVQYKYLSNDAKIKKFLLSHGLVGTFCYIKQLIGRAKGQITEG